MQPSLLPAYWHPTLLPVFQWLGHSALGIAMQKSTWGFAIVEMVHLLALASLGGAVLAVDLRLLGWTLRGQSPAEVARELTPLLTWSLVVLAISGVGLVSEEAMKCYYHPAFRLKMLLLALALLFHCTIHRRIVKDGPLLREKWQKSAGALSLVLWLSVGLAGRAIGFL